MTVCLFRCPDCKGNGTQKLIQLKEEVPLEEVECEFTCTTCGKKVKGELVKGCAGSICMKTVEKPVRGKRAIKKMYREKVISLSDAETLK